MTKAQLPFSQEQREDIERLLAARSDSEVIYQRLQELAGDDAETQVAFAEIAPQLVREALDSPNVDAALNHFARFAQAALSQNWLYDVLAEVPALMRQMMRSFGSSSYLADILVRNPEFFFDVLNPSIMGAPKTQQIMYDELADVFAELSVLEQKLGEMRRL